MEADELPLHRCAFCKNLSIEHDNFFFNHSPDAIRLQKGEEWQPGQDSPAIQGDKGPARVAYVWRGDKWPDHMGDPVVMVHEGDLEGLYAPCNAIRLESNRGVWLWLCQPISPKNPCGDDYMRSISS